MAEHINKLKAENNKLKAENDKLCSECDYWRVEKVHAYSNWEDTYKYAVKLKAENAKLRELVSLYHYGATHEASPSDVLAWSAKVDSLRRELGIEEEVAE